MRFSWIARVAAAFLTVVATNSAWAYIPPSQFIVKTLASKRNGFRGVRVQTTVTNGETEQDSIVRFRQITLFDAKSRTLRSLAFDQENKLLYAVERKFPGAFSKPETSALTVEMLLLDSNGEALLRQLKEVGLPVRLEEELLMMADEEQRRKSEMISISRLRNTVAWTISLDRKADDQHQLWIEKDTFLPMRLLTKSQGDWLDIQFENYRFFREFPYPRVVTVSHPDGKKILKEEVVDFEVNPNIKEFKMPAVPGFTDTGNSASSDVRELIQAYYSTVR